MWVASAENGCWKRQVGGCLLETDREMIRGTSLHTVVAVFDESAGGAVPRAFSPASADAQRVAARHVVVARLVPGAVAAF